ncbi:hypothetical protein FOA43_000642 [Brettanomyces nanus]|uniref:Uncharacterized protein n=1 Tax=Eeniella nana TaxID=13502 RepID=A0A875RZL5_EENNA|nr:uncharacterized protein FOA43_000642 [Brettanomyces nanus]QPG73332.1 hypothetical protein FOA43_000642 [Brettanomyces nanus]
MFGFYSAKLKFYSCLTVCVIVIIIMIGNLRSLDATKNTQRDDVIKWKDSLIGGSRVYSQVGARASGTSSATDSSQLRYDGTPELSISIEQLRKELKDLLSDGSTPSENTSAEKDSDHKTNPLYGTILDNDAKTNPNKAPVPDDYAGEVLTNNYKPYEQYRVVKKSYGNADKIPKATMFTIVKNSELDELLASIQQLESRFNRRFNYDWVFVNDEPFTDKFIEETSSMVSGTARYGIIPYEHWSYPSWIDQDKAKEIRDSDEAKSMPYGDSESYRFMCRYNSKYFYHHPIMEEYEYYWRVEPSVTFQCDIIEDPIRRLKENGILYGFTIAFLEFPVTIRTLWETSMSFFKNPDIQQDLIPYKKSMISFVSSDEGETYNNCHFWTNFEIASLEVWRSDTYEKYVDFLDRSGGFFYERWGDAPVHSIAISRMLSANQIHAFQDISYQHTEATSCPPDDDYWKRAKCTCNRENDWTVSSRMDCNRRFLKMSGQSVMKDYHKYLKLAGKEDINS